MTNQTIVAELNRYALIRARSRVLSYFYKLPHGHALGNDLAAFERAKAAWIEQARIALAEVEKLEYAGFISLRDDFKARKPTDCPGCGQTFANSGSGKSHE